MKHGWLAGLAILMWGNSVFASLTKQDEDVSRQVHVISSWMAHLNFYHPELQLSTSTADLADPETRQEILWQLRSLEEALQCSDQLPKKSLTRLACSRPACDGGGSGKCSTCADGR